MTKFITLRLALAGVIFMSVPAKASLYCVEVQGVPPQCIYDDPSACRARAQQLSGICDLNPAEAILSPGFARFCLVDASRTSQCVYPDRNTCEAEAARNHASICVENTRPGDQPNPYHNLPNRPY